MNYNEEAYRERELTSRNDLLNYISGLSWNIEFTEDLHDKVDAFVTGNTLGVIEQKYRLGYRKDDIVNMGGFMLEKPKWEALMSHPGYRPIYVNTTSDGWCLMWDVSYIKPEDFFTDKKKDYPISSTEPKGTKNKVVTYLNEDDAIWKKKIDK